MSHCSVALTQKGIHCMHFKHHQFTLSTDFKLFKCSSKT